jgi:hypothetical protein
MASLFVAAYGDGAKVAWDLEDVEAVVGRRHELGQGWVA